MNRQTFKALRSSLLLLVAGGFALPAIAAQGTASCKGYIDSLPATVSSQGVWCLRKNLSFSGSGAALLVTGNNVTIDCNDHAIQGQFWDTIFAASAVGSTPVVNLTVRNCLVRGFANAIATQGDGHLIERNRILEASYTGIQTQGDGNVVRRNQVAYVGGIVAEAAPNIGIRVLGRDGRVLDNDVRGLWANPGADFEAVGIVIENGIAQRNRISDMDGSSPARVIGIRLVNAIARDNLVSRTSAVPAPTRVGIEGNGTQASICQDNTTMFFTPATVGCQAVGHVTLDY